MEAYYEALDSLFGGKEESGNADKATLGNGPGAEAMAVYLVHVVDEDGPVEDVEIQLCTDTACTLKATGEDGVAAFESIAGGEREIHVLEVPDGYQEDDELYYPDESGEVTITLQKKD